MVNIIEFPDFKAFEEEVEQLRKDLTEIVVQRDELQFVICKNIETQYMLEIGAFEYKAYQTYCDYLRLRRKATLIQARKNRDERVHLEEIEKQLDREFEDYQQKLNKQLDIMNAALKRSQMEALSQRESEELKDLYRKIVKGLHPDLHPGQTRQMIELFNRAVIAYETGDLGNMRIIYELIKKTDPDVHPEDSMQKLKKDKARLQTMIRDVELQIEIIKQTYPYTLLKYLESDIEKQKKLDEIQSLQKSYEEAIKTQKERIATLVRGTTWEI